MSKDDLAAWAEEVQEEVLQEARERYGERAIGHWTKPHNFCATPDGCVSGRLTGPCGDTIEMYLSISDGRIRDVKFMTDGCGFTTACASYVTRIAKGQTIEDALRIKPQDVDSHFGGLPEENKHCPELAVGTLSRAITNYLAGSRDRSEGPK